MTKFKIPNAQIIFSKFHALNSINRKIGRSIHKKILYCHLIVFHTSNVKMCIFYLTNTLITLLHTVRKVDIVGFGTPRSLPS